MSHGVTILSLHFRPMTMKAALQITHGLIQTRRPAAIFTPNATIAEYAATHAAFRDILNRADLLLPDGIGLSLASARQGVMLPRIAGIDLAEALLATAPYSYRLFLLGGRPGIAEAAGRALCARFPRTILCGCLDGYYPPQKTHTVVQTVAAAAPDLLFVCLGSPRQEEWIALHRPPCTAIGLGGALDVWSGAVRRAPRTMQQMGLEWLWRSFSSPAHLRRLPSLAAFSVRALLTPPAKQQKKYPKCP